MDSKGHTNQATLKYFLQIVSHSREMYGSSQTHTEEIEVSTPDPKLAAAEAKAKGHDLANPDVNYVHLVYRFVAVHTDEQGNEHTLEGKDTTIDTFYNKLNDLPRFYRDDSLKSVKDMAA